LWNNDIIIIIRNVEANERAAVTIESLKNGSAAHIAYYYYYYYYYCITCIITLSYYIHGCHGQERFTERTLWIDSSDCITVILLLLWYRRRKCYINIIAIIITVIVIVIIIVVAVIIIIIIIITMFGRELLFEKPSAAVLFASRAV